MRLAELGNKSTTFTSDTSAAVDTLDCITVAAESLSLIARVSHLRRDGQPCHEATDELHSERVATAEARQVPALRQRHWGWVCRPAQQLGRVLRRQAPEVQLYGTLQRAAELALGRDHDLGSQPVQVLQELPEALHT